MVGHSTDLSLSRRRFLQAAGVAGSIAGISQFTLPFNALAKSAKKIQETSVWNVCAGNCHGRCALRLKVRDNEVYRVETDNTGLDIYGNHQIRACLRGRSIRRLMNHPDRLRYPMKRVGKRGEAKFERISWDEALDMIAANLQRIVQEYGNEVVYINYSSGISAGNITRSSASTSMVARLMNCYGGFLSHYGTYSRAQILTAMPYTYGTNQGNSTSDIINSKLVVYFGNNPMENRSSGAGVTYHLEQAREVSRAKMIIIDPRYSDTAAGREDEWIPIRPGTDAALAAAMAYVMITENLVDQPFLDKYCVGYDEKTLPPSAPKNGHYKAYILGDGDDRIAKTPKWAAPITGIPEETIIRLAREIATTKPCCITQGWGIQRQSNGELSVRAVAMLAILTGNVGNHGGNSGAREETYKILFTYFPAGKNPVKTKIPVFMWTDAVARGSELTALHDGIKGKDKLDVPIKFIWNYAGNTLVNQHSDINRTHDILQDESKCEMIVVIDNFLTSSARYADLLLPDLMVAEQADLTPNEYAGNMGYLIFGQPATTPKFERRSIYWMMSELAKRLGIEAQFTEGRSQEDWLKFVYEDMRKKLPDFPEYEQMKAQGIFKKRDPKGHLVAYKAFREDPEKNPLKTPSGKIEIYSESLAKLAATWQLEAPDIIHPLPIYHYGFNGYEDPKRQQYPFQLVGFHYKGRTHSSYGNVAILQAANPQEVWLNPLDAAAKNITDGAFVRLFNEHGETRLPAKVTPRIMPGVLAIPQGAWHQADMAGDKIDHNGSMNVITTQRPSPLAKGNPQQSNLVQIELVS